MQGMLGVDGKFRKYLGEWGWTSVECSASVFEYRTAKGPIHKWLQVRGSMKPLKRIPYLRNFTQGSAFFAEIDDYPTTSLEKSALPQQCIGPGRSLDLLFVPLSQLPRFHRSDMVDTCICRTRTRHCRYTFTRSDG
jgi:hypothetical protein